MRRGHSPSLDGIGNPPPSHPISSYANDSRTHTAPRSLNIILGTPTLHISGGCPTSSLFSCTLFLTCPIVPSLLLKILHPHLTTCVYTSYFPPPVRSALLLPVSLCKDSLEALSIDAVSALSNALLVILVRIQFWKSALFYDPARSRSYYIPCVFVVFLICIFLSAIRPKVFSWVLGVYSVSDGSEIKLKKTDALGASDELSTVGQGGGAKFTLVVYQQRLQLSWWLREWYRVQLSAIGGDGPLRPVLRGCVERARACCDRVV